MLLTFYMEFLYKLNCFCIFLNFFKYNLLSNGNLTVTNGNLTVPVPVTSTVY